MLTEKRIRYIEGLLSVALHNLKGFTLPQGQFDRLHKIIEALGVQLVSSQEEIIDTPEVLETPEPNTEL